MISLNAVMRITKEMLSNMLHHVADEVGKGCLGEDEMMAVFDMVNDISEKNNHLSKYEACEQLGFSRIEMRKYAISVATNQHYNATIEDILRSAKKIEEYVLKGIDVPDLPKDANSPYKDMLEILKSSVQYPAFQNQVSDEKKEA